ncbi:winged helix-turn-helix transcriptional regulator [Amycolatopsis sp. K13G38]|uniref:Winged helix-turn-helix transcriptional regulator n=1 Tax=Amycolatopsis acididurans TaxID=2724524 RepID=A0ABX1J0V3_9PSEU|nr:winged helix-turn-helix domain-containing protein [Amycolatopsis acididurans]NKQ51970.1 winged helix-turn-helix transcriptional regulator [Amycolatopsis acididurans]
MSSESTQYRIDPDGPVAPWRQVAEHLVGRMEADEWPDGRMPRQKDLAEQYDVSTPVISDAVAELREQGKVFTVTGQGTFVASSRAAQEQPRRRNTPVRGDKRQRWEACEVTQPLVACGDIWHLVDRVLDFERRTMRLLQEIPCEVTDSSNLSRKALRRLDALENAVVARQSQPLEPNPCNGTGRFGA